MRNCLRGALLVLLPLLVLFLNLPFLTCGVSKAEGGTSEGQLTRAVFEHNGQIYLYDEKARTITQVTSGESKYLPTLSRDKNLLAFAYSRFHTDNLSLQFGILDMRTKKIKNIVLPEQGLDMITEFHWINTQIVGIDCHISPYMAEYFIFDIERGILLKKYTGNLFFVMPDGKSVLYKGPISDEKAGIQVETLYINDTKIYSSNNSAYRIGFPQISPSQKKLVFFERDANDINKNYLVIADVNVAMRTISNIKRIRLTDEVRGVLYFDQENNVYLVNQETAFKANLEAKIFTKAPQIKMKGNNEVLSRKTELLNSTLNRFFKVDKTNHVVISNLQWF